MHIRERPGFERELDALIIARRAKLRAELCLICDELEID